MTDTVGRRKEPWVGPTWTDPPRGGENRGTRAARMVWIFQPVPRRGGNPRGTPRWVLRRERGNKQNNTPQRDNLLSRLCRILSFCFFEEDVGPFWQRFDSTSLASACREGRNLTKHARGGTTTPRSHQKQRACCLEGLKKTVEKARSKGFCKKELSLRMLSFHQRN